jgi:hypothetical protein
MFAFEHPVGLLIWKHSPVAPQKGCSVVRDDTIIAAGYPHFIRDDETEGAPQPVLSHMTHDT